MQKVCANPWCHQQFEVDDEDMKFYADVSPVIGGKTHAVPPPTICFDCRQQRRMAWRNEKRLYHRTCDLTGKEILSIYSPDKPYKVFEFHEWYSDAWSPFDYGRSYDFSKPFFQQFDQLHRDCPLRSFNMQEESVNSDYTNLANRNKNCYLIFAATENEDCYYSVYVQRNRDCMDCFFTFDSELCYECIDCYNCHSLTHSQYCSNCHDSALLFGCIGCNNCFGCAALSNKRFCIFNQELSEKDFRANVASFRASSEAWADAVRKFEEIKLRAPHKHYMGLSNENVTGDHVSYSKDVQSSFDCTYLERCRYCTWFHKSHACWDCYAWGFAGELCYENHLCGSSFQRVLFSESCWNNISDLLYCRYCLDGCDHCFGCVSLRHAKYCILNKQYTKEEYEALVPRIIEHMRTIKEWGEFFPLAISSYGYNETVAHEYFPLTKDEVRQRGWKWSDFEVPPPKAEKIIKASMLPYAIEEIPDDVLNWAIECEATKKPFKLTKPELAFYRNMKLPIPKVHFEERHRRRMLLRNPRKLWSRQCAKCKKAIQTTYAPDHPEIVYCEDCYTKEVY